VRPAWLHVQRPHPAKTVAAADAPAAGQERSLTSGVIADMTKS